MALEQSGKAFVQVAGDDDGGKCLEIVFGQETEIGVRWVEIGYGERAEARVRDIWQKKELGTFRGGFTAAAAHGVVMVRVNPK